MLGTPIFLPVLSHLCIKMISSLRAWHWSGESGWFYGMIFKHDIHKFFNVQCVRKKITHIKQKSYYSDKSCWYKTKPTGRARFDNSNNIEKHKRKRKNCTIFTWTQSCSTKSITLTISCDSFLQFTKYIHSIILAAPRKPSFLPIVCPHCYNGWYYTIIDSLLSIWVLTPRLFLLFKDILCKNVNGKRQC